MKLIRAEVTEREASLGCTCRWRGGAWCECALGSGRYSADLTYEVHVRAEFVEPDGDMVGQSGPRLERAEWTHRGESEREEWARRSARWAVEHAMKQESDR
jgi:hypothetical protein